MRTRRPKKIRDHAMPPLRREVISAAARFMKKFGRFNNEAFSLEDNTVFLYEAEVLLTDIAIPSFVSKRLPETTNWPKFFIRAVERRPVLNIHRGPFVGHIALERVEGSAILDHTQRIWRVDYAIDSFRNRCQISRTISGEIISLVCDPPQQVESLPSEEIASKFPPTLGIAEAEQLRDALENPHPLTKAPYIPGDIYYY